MTPKGRYTWIDITSWLCRLMVIAFLWIETFRIALHIWKEVLR